MYWLMEQNEQDTIRDKVYNLATTLSVVQKRDQMEQFFPFNGRKNRSVAHSIIQELTDEGDVVCDPFSGSGIFTFAALDMNRRAIMNEWEPYAFRMSTLPFRSLPDLTLFEEEINKLKLELGPMMHEIYDTVCPNCGSTIMLDGFFYDRVPLEYFSPTYHERLGTNGENIIFRRKYKCQCGCTQKSFDENDMRRIEELEAIVIDFPEYRFIENSRINFTNPDYITYDAIFPKRSKIALVYLRDYILSIDDENVREFFYDAFLSIIHLGKYTDD